MTDHRVVSHAEWVEARKRHLAAEKEFTDLRDKLTAERQAMPWERVEKEYVFDGPDGRETLKDLFDGHSQLIAQHFMLGDGWAQPCKSCSFWADNYNGTQMHLAARDIAFVAVSSAPLAQIEAVRKRLGWNFTWVSGAEFNHDFQTHFTPDELKGDVEYNYRPIRSGVSELPGASVFLRDEDGTVYHTYSCYSRGLDMLNGAYNYIDLTPKGRDEAGPHKMTWVRLNDSYGA